MIDRQQIGASAFIAGIGAFGSYWLTSSLIKMSCQPIYHDLSAHKIGAESTAFLAAAGIGVTIFAFVIAALSKQILDRFDKLLLLALAGYAVVWLLALIINADVCSPIAWRKYLAFLIGPSLLAVICLLGRDWLKADD